MESAVFALLPNLLERIKQLNAKRENGNFVKFKQRATTNEFQAIAITPGCNRAMFLHQRPFIALYKTLTTGRSPMTLLAAIAMDANNLLVLLSFALVSAESTLWWE